MVGHLDAKTRLDSDEPEMTEKVLDSEQLLLLIKGWSLWGPCQLHFAWKDLVWDQFVLGYLGISFFLHPC